MTSDQLRVDADDLLISSSIVDGHAATLHEMHSASGYAIEGALTGLPALAATVMAERSAEWNIATIGLISRLAGHAATFSEAGASYVTQDETNGDRLRGIGSGLRFI